MSSKDSRTQYGTGFNERHALPHRPSRCLLFHSWLWVWRIPSKVFSMKWTWFDLFLFIMFAALVGYVVSAAVLLAYAGKIDLIY